MRTLAPKADLLFPVSLAKFFASASQKAKDFANWLNEGFFRVGHRWARINTDQKLFRVFA